MSLPDATAHGCGCDSCRRTSGRSDGSAADHGYVYAIGTIEVRFPSIGVEKEFAQAQRRAATADLSDRHALHAVLTATATRYLARHLCFVFSVQGIEAYLLQANDSADVQGIVDALTPGAPEASLDVVVGLRRPLAPPSYCNGLSLPLLAASQIFSTDQAAFVRSAPKPDRLELGTFNASLQQVVAPIMQSADNVGADDAHRAINYLTVRYPALYAKLAEAHADGFHPASIDVSPSRLAGSRKILSVVYTCVQRQNGVADKFFARVDVTEQFPFLVTGLLPYFNR